MTICWCHWQQIWRATDRLIVERPTDRPSDKNKKKHARFVQLEITNVLITSQKLTSFCEKKDKNGNVIADENGSKTCDLIFFQANRCLRNTAGFKEGSSFDDDEAHFVIQKLGKIILVSSCFLLHPPLCCLFLL